MMVMVFFDHHPSVTVLRSSSRRTFPASRRKGRSLTSGAFQRTPFFQKEAEGRASSRRNRQRWSFPKEGKKLHLWRFPKEAGKRGTYVLKRDAGDGRLEEGRVTYWDALSERSPPEVKLPEGSRQRWSFPKEAEGRPSFGRTRFFQNKFIKPKDALFSKQVHQAARGEAFRRTFRNKFSFVQKAELPKGTSWASFRKLVCPMEALRPSVEHTVSLWC